MESTIVFWIVLGFVFGGMLLALVMGYMSIEEKRAQEAKAQEAQVLSAVRAMVSMPRFFPALDAESPVLTHAIDPGLLARLEDYVRAEQAMVHQFVHEPSIDALYRQSSPSIHLQ